MEVMVETCCGIDVHQKSIVCCILDGPLDTNKQKNSIVPLVQQQRNSEKH